MESTMIYYFIILTIATLVVVIIGMYRQLADAWTRVHVAEDEVLELRDTIQQQERQLEWWREQDNAGWTGSFDD